MSDSKTVQVKEKKLRRTQVDIMAQGSQAELVRDSKIHLVRKNRDIGPRTSEN